MKTATAFFKPSPSLADLGTYDPPRAGTPVDLHLDSNEGRLFAGELLTELSRAGSDIVSRYPDKVPLERQIAQMMGLKPEEVLVTAGADDALERVIRATLTKERELILPVPTFEMLDRYAKLTGCRIKEMPWLEGAYPTGEVLQAVTGKTALIAVVTPNSPTGLVATASDLERLSAGAPNALILVDLAYTDFADIDLTVFALKLPNAVVVRTLSKAWGLAGLRVGWAAGPKEVIDYLRAIGHPYAVSSPSLSMASARLRTGLGDVARFLARIRKERADLFDLLAALGANPLESQANFVFASFKDAIWLRDGLAGLGIAVRVFSGRRFLDSGARVTLPGDEAQFDRLCSALRTVLKPDALLFDIDDTLADVTCSYREATIETARLFGAKVTPEDITAAKAAGNANNDWDLTWRLIRDRGIDVSLEEVTRKFEEMYQGDASKPGMKNKETPLVEPAVLKRLSSRFKLGVVTGRPRRDALCFLEKFGLRHLFGAIVTMEQAPLKPSPEPVRLALRQLSVEGAWMVGDTPDDMRSARAAGVLPLAVFAPADNPSVARPALIGAGACRVLTKLEDIEELLP